MGDRGDWKRRGHGSSVEESRIPVWDERAWTVQHAEKLEEGTWDEATWDACVEMLMAPPTAACDALLLEHGIGFGLGLGLGNIDDDGIAQPDGGWKKGLSNEETRVFLKALTDLRARLQDQLTCKVVTSSQRLPAKKRLTRLLAVQLMSEHSPWFSGEYETKPFPWQRLCERLYPDKNTGVLTPKECVVSHHLKAILDALDYQHVGDHKHRLFGVLAAIQHTKFPFMEPCISVVVPFLLNIINQEASALAPTVAAVHHFLHEITPPDIQWNGLHKAIYEQLLPLLYKTEEDIVSTAWPCMATLLPMLAHAPTTLADSVYTEVWEKVLTFSAHERMPAKQLAIAASLSPLIKVSGISCIQHTAPILDLLLPMLQQPPSTITTATSSSDDRLVVTAANALVVFCQQTSARPSRAKRKALFRAKEALSRLPSKNTKVTTTLFASIDSLLRPLAT